MKHRETNDTSAKLLLDVTEVAHICNLSRSKIYSYILAGEIRSVLAGRRRLVPSTAVAEFVAALEREAAERQG